MKNDTSRLPAGENKSRFMIYWSLKLDFSGSIRDREISIPPPALEAADKPERLMS
jgi:hypothetical protein